MEVEYMLRDSKAFSGFSVTDIEAARAFYGDTLGLAVEVNAMGMSININGSIPIFIYQKPDHTPAKFTILNFPVDNIDDAVDDLVSKGVTFEQYNNPEIPQDAKGIGRGKSANMGPDIAWFKDPAGNILSLLAE